MLDVDNLSPRPIRLCALQDTRTTLPPGASSASDSDGCYFYLAGVDDFEADPDYEAALDGRNESKATVLLAHEPKQVSFQCFRVP